MPSLKFKDIILVDWISYDDNILIILNLIYCKQKGININIKYKQISIN